LSSQSTKDKSKVLLVTEKPSKKISDRMRKVKSKDTLIERTMERLLKQLYLKYEKQPRMIGHPDFILRMDKVAIFCDSSFWHGRASQKQVFKRNRLFWEKKIQENRRRDRKNNRILRGLGWKVLRFWDDDILKRPRIVARRILRAADPPIGKRLAAVEIFCGAGGMAHGFYLEGIRVVAGFDVDATCKYAYEKNNLAKFFERNVSELNAAEIKQLYPQGSIRVLAGCAPCQPFSPYARSKKKAKSDKWKLLYDFSRMVDRVHPDIVTMENVPSLISYNGGRVFSDFVNHLKNEGYHLWYDIVDCAKYGIPQYRRRLVLLASRLGDISLIPRTHSPKELLTVRDAIDYLEPVDAGASSKKDPLHRSRNLTARNMLRIMATPEGGNWSSWPKDLILKCHKKNSGRSFKNVYGRMSWKEPGPTITTEFIGLGNGRFGHPVQDRAISLREAALLQTFPFYYDFINPKAKFSMKRIAIHIGNAVPVRLGQIIAKSIKQHIEAVNLA
jgi:DNA (cytosine-5)-methyltransferase 1